MTDPTDRERLSGLVNFAAELLKAREKTVMRLAEYGLGLFHEKEITTLPGLRFSDDDTWLAVERLRPSEAPTFDAVFEGWIVGDLNDPAKGPSLDAVVTRLVTIEEASDLAEAGIIAEADVHPYWPAAMRGRGDGEQGTEPEASDSHVYVVLRTERMPEWQVTFDNWRNDVWQPWADIERPRRRTIALYQVLYRLHGMIQAGSDTHVPEIVWGIGIAKWAPDGNSQVDMPLIEKPCELLLAENGTLIIGPRSLPAIVNLRPFREVNVPEADRAQSALSSQVEARSADQDVPLHPHDPVSFEDILAGAATRLSASARFVPATDIQTGEKLPQPSAELVVYGTWVVYARPRSDDLRHQDLKRIEEAIRGTPEDTLQKPLVGLVKPPADTRTDTGVDLREWGFERTGFEAARPVGASSGPLGIKEAGTHSGELLPAHPKKLTYFFPLPFNAEQAQIVDTLEREDVAVVKGPPGTGKTHTIANVIAHYMATGRRVLVTARTAEAIAAVQDKLPAALRTMTIAVVHSDREGAKQLQEAVQALANEASSSNSSDIKRRIVDIQDEIVHIDSEIGKLDRSLGDTARANLGTIRYDGTDHLPMDLATILAQEEAWYGWFTDRPAKTVSGSRMGELVDLIVELRSSLGGDLEYLGSPIPAPEDLPVTVDLVAAKGHEARRRSSAAEDYSNAPLLVLDSPEDEQRARKAHASVIQFAAQLEQMSEPSRLLYRNLVSEMAGQTPPASLQRWVDRALGYLAERERISPHDISLPDFGTDALAGKIEAAVARLSMGQKPFGFAAQIFAQDVKKALGEFRIGDAAPQTAQDWMCVTAYRRWQTEHNDFVAQWQKQPLLPPIADDPGEFLDIVRRLSGEFAAACKAASQTTELQNNLKRFFPYDLDIDTAVRSADFSAVLFAFRANLQDDTDRPHPALEALQAVASQGKGPVFDALGELASNIANGTCTERNIVEARSTLTRDLQALKLRASALESLSSSLVLLAHCGAPDWAERLKNPLNLTPDVVPSDWEKAWSWAVARRRIDEILQLENPAALTAKKAELVSRRAHLFEKLIRERTLLGLKGHLTDKIKQALVLFTTAMQKLGAGTGKSAFRLRRQIRDAALDAAPAAPVWIMPEYRVAEQLPASLGSFDLVVLDEASQSDVTALGALARGKKWLVVGDEQQVSPSSVGMPQAQIDSLRAQYLRHVNVRNAIDQDTSIFDMASMMFPASQIMLREHFRCVAPIIQFSTRFYGGRLIPLRIPKASERLDPPLIDIFVADGEYRSKWNPQERDVIVDEIAKIVTDRTMQHRTIAVISLVGSVQAEQIERALIAHPLIGHEAIERHRIICGDSRTMQGQERDIVFLSMVQAGKVAALTARSMAQRFNVAMSRARDRVYLVRSLAVSQLKSEDLKRQVIEHFAQPMPAGRKLDGKGVLDRCQSGLERDVCRRLLDAGYRVRSQVEAGPYAIDLVVEGAEDRRLAIELDGDKFHGPDRWDDDMRRQAALERAGWVFWRVFGSQWNTETEFWWKDLLDTLDRLRIAPIGAEASQEIYTEHRRVQGGKLVSPKGSSLEQRDVDADTIDAIGLGLDAFSPEEAAGDVIAPANDLISEPVLGKTAQMRPQPAIATEGATADDLGQAGESLRALYGGIVVTAGATVRVRYLDRDKVMNIIISERENAPDRGIVHIAQPLAQALLGAGVDEVVTYEVNGGEQEVLVEEIFESVAIAAE